MRETNVVVVGATPETSGVGGVSIHVDRLVKGLADRGVCVSLCDYKKVSVFRQIKLISRGRIVHIHASHPVLRLFYVMLGRLLRKPTILTVHGNLGRFGRIKNFIDRCAVRLCKVPVMINQNSYQAALKLNEHAVLMSAFLPPASEEPLHESIMKLIGDARNKYGRIAVTNASVKAYTVSGEEIYGIGFLTRYFASRKDYALFISDPSGQYAQSIHAKNVYCITIPHSFYSLLKEADLMIRGTVTDGDSISVREALSLGIPVVATDCVDRPVGVNLYQYDDKDSLEDAMEHVTGAVNVKGSDDDNISKIIEVYRSVII